MIDADRKPFATLIATALATWDKEVNMPTVQFWWDAMQTKGYSLAQISHAFSRHVMDPERGRFKPMPADIVRAIEGTGQDHAVAAWAIVFDAMARIGAYRTVVFDDPAIMAAINDTGGWPKLCRTSTEELQFAQKRFADTYRAYRNMPGHPHPKLLVGDHSSDEEYEKKAMKPPAPVLIGDPVRCKEVMEGGRSAIVFATRVSDKLLEVGYGKSVD